MTHLHTLQFSCHSVVPQLMVLLAITVQSVQLNAQVEEKISIDLILSSEVRVLGRSNKPLGSVLYRIANAEPDGQFGLKIQVRRPDNSSFLEFSQIDTDERLIRFVNDPSIARIRFRDKPILFFESVCSFGPPLGFYEAAVPPKNRNYGPQSVAYVYLPESGIVNIDEKEDANNKVTHSIQADEIQSRVIGRLKQPLGTLHRVEYQVGSGAEGTRLVHLKSSDSVQASYNEREIELYVGEFPHKSQTKFFSEHPEIKQCLAYERLEWQGIPESIKSQYGKLASRSSFRVEPILVLKPINEVLAKIEKEK